VFIGPPVPPFGITFAGYRRENGFGAARATEAAMADQLSQTEVVRTWVERRREELQEQALPLGERLYEETPKQFTRRLKAYWRAWRSERAGEGTRQPAHNGQAAG
jgi:hypothetical protein